MRWGLVLGIAVACGKGDGSVCAGEGEAGLELGEGGLDGFVPWSDGAGVPIEQSNDAWGFHVELLTEGIDTTSDVTSFLHYKVGPGGDTVDAGATLDLQCPEEGPGWYAVFVPFGDEYQDEAAAIALDGIDVFIDGTVTDIAADTASDTVKITLEAP